ncbi:hypothetical protein TrCOL_g13616 [Triparma columacea]|uniref:P-loop containing nucleoside triphosphate hydrolase protein n=1 Tax=Triparma columacea TaxID=722753 RepID=A0A9W7FXG9_9STRA|nr:hypothetical protein TrCOL_g13616 [Triparma columacea]
MNPSSTYDEPPTTTFGGWSKYCSKVASFEVTKVGKPLLGRVNPRVVEATFTIDLSLYNDNIRREWDNWDDANLYLLNVNGTKVDNSVPATNLRQLGVERVRGCKVTSVTDNDGNELTNQWGSNPIIASSPIRNIKVNLDTTQFYMDEKTNKLDVYKEFNVVMRRDPVNNNAPPFLQTLNSISQTTSALPRWLEPTFLGFGNPEDAWGGGEKMKRWAETTPGVPKPTDSIDFGTCFQDDKHIKESFPSHKVTFTGQGQGSKLKFDEKTVFVTHYEPTTDTKSTPRFTPVQVEAIKSGINPGLTLVVGPPGTGKTDTAVAIITNLVRSYPNQRILMVTHSNAALNDLFEKIVATNIVDERYMIRLGGGEKQLNVDSTHDFTKRGRVAYTLARRELLLKDVQLLSESLYVGSKNDRGPNGESSYTCETAELFNKHHVIARIQLYYSNGTDAPFPFEKYCELKGETEPTGEEATKAYFDKLQELFDELKDFRAFELLRGGGKRSEYLLTKQAKIVACTVTHAGLARDQLINLGFKYDSVVVEEAGQQLEVETFIPLLLQKDPTRLKRICLFGDHNQLPPILKDRDLAEKGNFSQSFFARMISLGIKSFTLDSQGRARPEIAALYEWRYGGLKPLPNTSEGAYLKANGGLLHNTQFVNVADYEGRGENCPTPYFYQNLGEAEYVVAMFQYMVLIGYDPKKITILTTYNGQKALVEDVLRARCNNVLFRFLPQVFTVDKYQGQQNDIILLSLVRTERVGHLRDVRRLVVALSRSRLGLYIFGREELFKEVKELEPAFSQMWEKGTELKLVKGEGAGTDRDCGNVNVKGDKLHVCKGLTDLGQIVGGLQAMALQGVQTS